MACGPFADGSCVAGRKRRDFCGLLHAMNFVTWSIRNPIPVVVMFAALLIAVLVGFAELGVQDRPDIDFPAVTVTVSYPGSPPSQLESEVTRKIEDSIATITGINHITSTINEGVSTTRVEFHFGRNINEALDDVRDAVTRVRSDLPQNVNEPIVSRVTASRTSSSASLMLRPK